MNRRLLIGLFAVSGLAAAAVAYRWFVERPNPRSEQAAEAMHLWSKVDKSTEREHELKTLQSSLKQNPDHIPILLRMAQVSRELGKTAEAVSHLREAVRVDAGNKEARLELGRLLFDSGDVGGAIRETEQLLKLDPSNIDGLYNMGAIYGNLGDDERARRFWKKAVDVAPNSESAQRARDALKQIGG